MSVAAVAVVMLLTADNMVDLEGGGAGGFRYPNSTLSDAVQPSIQNTGGGGGGARIDNPNEGAGGNGGSGIILIAYPT